MRELRYAAEERLSYVDWRLVVHGSVRRAHLMRQFGISEAQASGDIGAFLAVHPGAVTYDGAAKQYVPANGRYRSRRGWTKPAIAAMAALAAAHPLGWRD